MITSRHPVNASSSSSSLLPENRRAPRARTLKTGKLFFGGFHKTAIDCLILDLSESGVRIETAVMIDAPETAFLQIQGEMIGPMKKRWATGNQIGFELPAPKA
jgi:hypothetical protein